MPSNLPKLDFAEDIEKYEAHAETKNIEFVKCPHKHTRIDNGVLKCSCGNGWHADNATLIELQKLLSRQTT